MGLSSLTVLLQESPCQDRPILSHSSPDTLLYFKKTLRMKLIDEKYKLPYLSLYQARGAVFYIIGYIWVVQLQESIYQLFQVQLLYSKETQLLYQIHQDTRNGCLILSRLIGLNPPQPHNFLRYQQYTQKQYYQVSKQHFPRHQLMGHIFFMHTHVSLIFTVFCLTVENLSNSLYITNNTLNNVGLTH